MDPQGRTRTAKRCTPEKQNEFASYHWLLSPMALPYIPVPSTPPQNLQSVASSFHHEKAGSHINRMYNHVTWRLGDSKRGQERLSAPEFLRLIYVSPLKFPLQISATWVLPGIFMWFFGFNTAASASAASLAGGRARKTNGPCHDGLLSSLTVNPVSSCRFWFTR